MKIIKENDSTSLEIACNALKAGEIISFATDTIYGIAVDAGNFQAVEDLYSIKDRELSKPFAIFLKDLESAKKAFIFDKLATKISEKHFPGSLTMVLKEKSGNPLSLAKNINQNNDNSLGFRIVNRKFIEKLLSRFDGTLAVTSANISKQEAAKNISEVQKYFTGSKLTLLIDGGDSNAKNASTIVKINNNKLEILRHGSIPESDL